MSAADSPAPASDGHVSVLAAAATDALLGNGVGGEGGCYLDATFGGGGHSRMLLGRLNSDSRLLALDCDERAEEEAAKVADPRFVFFRRNFSQLAAAAADCGMSALRGALFDLGVSSFQLDCGERGLSFMRKGPLDMRLDRRSGRTAKQLLESLNERELARLLKMYGEEPEARRVARAIFGRRGSIADTAELAKIVADSKRAHPPHRHPATLVFQALRMAVNGELESLHRGLVAAAELLAQGGRLAVIAFHSLEDRLVKRTMSAPAFPGFGRAGGLGMRPAGRSIVPDEEEVAANPRARSARLRVFVKEGAAA